MIGSGDPAQTNTIAVHGAHESIPGATSNRVVAKGPNSPTNKGKLGIFGRPRPNKNMPTPCPYILILLTPREAAAEGREPFRPHICRNIF